MSRARQADAAGAARPHDHSAHHDGAHDGAAHDAPAAARPARGANGLAAGLASGLLAAAVTAVATAAGIAAARRLADVVQAQLADHRRARTRLQPRWTCIAGVAGPRPIALHSRHADGAPSTEPPHASPDGPLGGPPDVPPVVLVHGAGVSGGYWERLALRLAGHAAVHVPDLPGHGQSAADVRPLGVIELAEALARWLDARGIGGALLVGNSMGAQVVAELAVRRPDLCAGLVLVGPTCDAAGRRALVQAARLVPAGLHEAPGVLAWALADYLQAGPRLLLAELHALVAHPLEAALVQVEPLGVPTRVVRGAHDRVVPASWAGMVAQLAGAPPPRTVPRGGHAVHYDEPDAVAAEVLAVLQLLAAERRPARRLTTRRGRGGAVPPVTTVASSPQPDAALAPASASDARDRATPAAPRRRPRRVARGGSGGRGTRRGSGAPDDGLTTAQRPPNDRPTTA